MANDIPASEFSEEARHVIDAFAEVVMPLAKETNDRIRRIETRLYKLCEKAGVEPQQTTMPLGVATAPDGVPVVKLPGYDVTFSAIKHALQKAEVKPGTLVWLWVNDRPVASVRYML